jgi:hypothetical protein
MMKGKESKFPLAVGWWCHRSLPLYIPMWRRLALAGGSCGRPTPPPVPLPSRCASQASATGSRHWQGAIVLPGCAAAPRMSHFFPFLQPVMKSLCPLLQDMIWCLFACEVLGMTCYLYYAISESDCLEAPGWWTNDHWHVSKASKSYFCWKNLTFSITAIAILQTFKITCWFTEKCHWKLLLFI